MKISVLIPARNEERVLARTLRSLFAAGIGVSDIYVVDDGSTDATDVVARSLRVNVLRNDLNIGKAKSVERASLHFSLASRYELIALMDADSQVSPLYFNHVRQVFKGRNVAMVSGHVRNFKHNWLTAYRGLVYFMAHNVYRTGQDAMGVITVVPGFAVTFRADAFSKLSWDDDTVTEDMDVTVQVHKRKLGRIAYAKEALTYTQDPQTLRDYIYQMMRWYSGTWQVAKKHGMWGGTSKIDWEFKLLVGEALLFTLLVALAPVFFFFYPRFSAWAVAADFSWMAILSLVCAVSESRWDVLAYAFTYPFLRIVDCGIVLSSFWKVVVRKQNVRAWFSPGRYQIKKEAA